MDTEIRGPQGTVFLLKTCLSPLVGGGPPGLSWEGDVGVMRTP